MKSTYKNRRRRRMQNGMNGELIEIKNNCLMIKARFYMHNKNHGPTF